MNDPRKKAVSAPSPLLTPEEYQNLDDREKDLEVVRSILRLQSSIQKIRYVSEMVARAHQEEENGNTD